MADTAAHRAGTIAGPPADDREQAELAELIRFIQDARGFDFAAYKQGALTRRLRKRMHQVGVAGYLEYRDLLESSSDEFGALFDTVLINVTSFFRDAASWTYLRREVIPAIAARVGPEGEIRVWSAGCSTGEEAYTLAILFAEVLGVPSCVERVKIYGTDVDEQALRVARAGAYPATVLQTVPAELRPTYFDADGDRYTFRADLRRRVIFGHHDITRDAPISRLDLLVCRNTLMYYNIETQSHIVDRFHFALRGDGFLFLGKAEMLLRYGERFEAVSMCQRVFRRRHSDEAGIPYRPMETPGLDRQPEPTRGDLRSTHQARDLVLEALPLATIVVDTVGKVVLISGRARTQFMLSPQDVGRPFHELEVSYRPAELRSLTDQARAERRTVRLDGVERPLRGDESQYLDIVVQPLSSSDGRVIGTAIFFADATSVVRLRQELNRTREDLITAYEELQSTNEELETTNEELQSSIEELETTNEELQSTNEELATTNQELQANIDELERRNEEVRVRGAEVDETRSFLQGILSSLTTGVVVLDPQLNVRSWNRGAEDLWGLRAEEVHGHAFFDLDFGLPTGQLRDLIGECLTAGRRTGNKKIDALSRTGRALTCSVACAPLGHHEGSVVLLMDKVRDA